jgi:hypothetical protein
VKQTAVFLKSRFANGLKEYARVGLEPLISERTLSEATAAGCGIGLKMLEVVSNSMGMPEKQALTTRANRRVVVGFEVGAVCCSGAQL